jgi:hypothetical protein
LTYEDLLVAAEHNGLIVKEQPLLGNDGRISCNRIAIRNTINTQTEKSCVLAEELGHYYTTAGNILDQSRVTNRKQELHARFWAYNQMIGLLGLIQAYEHGCRSQYEIAEYLDVTEAFLKGAIDCYASKYGDFVSVDSYIIYFVPTLGVMKITG